MRLRFLGRQPRIKELTGEGLSGASLRDEMVTLLLVGLALLSATAGAALDTGQRIFFPRELGEKVEGYAAFPMTWWNFLTFDVSDDADFAGLSLACARLRASAAKEISAIACGDSLAGFEPVLRAWARDVALREPMPSPAALGAKLEGTLARASLPLPRELLTVLRFDPLGSYRQLLGRFQSRELVHLPRVHGFYYDAGAHRALIPVKLAFPPARGDRTERFVTALRSTCGTPAACDRWGFLGPHAATYENQRQIRHDVRRASTAGTVLLSLILLAAALFGKAQLLVMAPLVGVAVVASYFATSLVFGSIHGLTLSFGSGIVGLALDYGFHQALNPRPYVGRSNFFGLLTTLAALAVVMGSRVPLLRQMMFFSGIGIAIAFVLIRLAARFGWLTNVPSPRYTPKPSRAKAAFSVVLLLGIPLGFFRLHPGLDLARFNFQSEKDRALMMWLVKATSLSPPLFAIDRGAVASRLERARELTRWAEASRIRIESVGAYLPSLETQRRNLSKWRGERCGVDPSPIAHFAAGLSPDERGFFSPFFDGFGCATLSVLGTGPLPGYASDLSTPEAWLTLFFPSSDEEVRAIRERVPDATSLRALVAFFPETLSAELRWMAPLSLLLIWGLLLLHYRRVSATWLPLIPFFTGVGFAAWVAWLGHLEVSFVTLVGLIMLCGLSVDYGIFAADAARFARHSEGREAVPGAWTAILFAALATLSGFVPLLFCRHAVLAQLGQVLTLGTIGTCLGAVWAVPSFAALFGKEAG